MLIGGASTLFFNGNPLLRFDGYYILADLLEIPNLASRANRHIFYVVQRRLLGITDVSSPAFAPGERAWFVIYGVAAFTYRVFIMVAIALFVATKLFFIGVILALWAAVQMFGIPTGKGIWFLFDSPRLRRRRTRALVLSGGAAAILAGLFFFMPVPHGTTAEGVVWIPEQSRLYAATDGAVARIVAGPNSAVGKGDALVQMEDPLLSSRIDVLAGEVAELEARFEAAQIDDLVQAEIIRQQAGHARAELAEARERAAALTVRSTSDGQFILPNAADLQDRFVRRGELVAYVVDDATLTIRVALPQSNIDLVRQRTRGVEVRFADNFWRVEEALVKNVVPTVTRQLPSLTLSTEGGGRIHLDPTDPDGGALAPVLQIDLAVPSVADATTFGGRVYVRFDHGSEPLASRLYLQLRRLFLSRFDV